MPVICFAPQYVCEALLRADGFTDVRYVDTTVEMQAEDLGVGPSTVRGNPVSQCCFYETTMTPSGETSIILGIYQVR